MEIGSIKYGIGIAMAFMGAVCLLFTLYWRLGEASVRKARKKAAQKVGSNSH